MTQTPLREGLDPKAYKLVNLMDRMFERLLMGSSPGARKVSFELYRAALAVALRGEDEVSKELTKRVLNRGAQLARQTRNEHDRFWTARRVKASRRAKSRAPKAGENETAYEEAGRAMNVAPSTAEKRAYRKPKR